MKKVIYISYMPLTERVARDWYVDYLIAHGVSVEYWDLTQLLFGDVGLNAGLASDYSKTITSYQQLAEYLGKQKNDAPAYVMLVTYEPRFIRLYRLLAHYGCKTYFFNWGNFPIQRQSPLARLYARLANPVRLAKSLANGLMFSIDRKMGAVKPFDVVFAAGYASLVQYPDTPRKIPINLIDYDHYQDALQKPERLSNEKYAVFLDTFLPFHPDFKLLNMPYLDAERYLESLNRFFARLEAEHDLKIIIAAHPKSEYSNNLFGGRSIYKGVTSVLVKDAEFVASHHSTSISYAVLNNKPLLFIYTNEMEDIYYNTITRWIADFAAYLDSPVINIDRLGPNQALRLNQLNVERYTSYKYQFLTTRESEKYATRDIFLKEIISP